MTITYYTISTQKVLDRDIRDSSLKLFDKDWVAWAIDDEIEWSMDKLILYVFTFEKDLIKRSYSYYVLDCDEYTYEAYPLSDPCTFPLMIESRLKSMMAWLMHVSCMRDSIEIVEAFFSYGCDTDNAYGYPLVVAVEYNSWKCIRFLKENCIFEYIIVHAIIKACKIGGLWKK